ncbi:MAG: DUF6282 family protein [Syntrophorhabdaceae bacterium]|nr:DUF6282 family protein [Syntrophorhabdaceae bacterium]
MNTLELIRDAYDLHVHSAPDVLPRKFDDLEMAQRVIVKGMGGYAIKSHYFCTAERAKLIKKIYPTCDAIGTITLNSAVGGINPMAVEMAGRAGAKIVWFPTVDSEHELMHLSNTPQEKLPYWARIKKEMEAEGIQSPTINILNEGRLKDEVYDTLDVISRFNMVLATSHISKAEAYALVKEAKNRKVERIIITHVDFPSTFYSIEEQKELLKYGAYMEHCYTTPATGKVLWEVALEQIKAIGPAHVIIGTDLGQATGIFPDEGLLEYSNRLLNYGFTEEDVRTMLVENPSSLIR